MILIDQDTFKVLLHQKAVHNITVYREADRKWYFTFTMRDKKNGDKILCSLKTQKGLVKEWADPRNLFNYFLNFEITIGQFKLSEGLLDEFKKQIQYSI